MVTKQACKYKRNLFLPHTWLTTVLKIYRIDETLITFLESTMRTWETTLILGRGDERITIPSIKIWRGVFQGDSLSLIWFCLALNPLSNTLNDKGMGYEIRKLNEKGQILSHLLYMDDLKLYARNEREIKTLLTRVANFSNDIKMKFGLEKCRTMSIKRGKQVALTGEVTMDGEEIMMEALQGTEMYKYLGMEQRRMTEKEVVKERLRKEFQSRIRKVCTSRLNSGNLIEGINTYAIPVLTYSTYSFGVIHWSDA